MRENHLVRAQKPLHAYRGWFLSSHGGRTRSVFARASISARPARRARDERVYIKTAIREEDPRRLRDLFESLSSDRENASRIFSWTLHATTFRNLNPLLSSSADVRDRREKSPNAKTYGDAPRSARASSTSAAPARKPSRRTFQTPAARAPRGPNARLKRRFVGRTVSSEQSTRPPSHALARERSAFGAVVARPACENEGSHRTELNPYPAVHERMLASFPSPIASPRRTPPRPRDGGSSPTLTSSRASSLADARCGVGSNACHHARCEPTPPREQTDEVLLVPRAARAGGGQAQTRETRVRRRTRPRASLEASFDSERRSNLL